MPNGLSINLLRSQEKNLLEKFINWALRAGRVIIIFTEGLALFAFLYRFSLDMQLTDLNSRIKQQQNIVAYSKASEEKYRNLQERLSFASNLSKKADEPVIIMEDIIKSAPPGVTFSNLIISESKIHLDASFQSSLSLNSFIKALKEHPKIQGVSIDRIENRASSAKIIVSVSASLKNTKK